MQNNPLFSILIAQYNNGHFFKDCYKSIIEQSYTNWEVIIVDDGSTDDSVNIIRNIVGDDIRFKLYLNSNNKGCGFTKNKCVHLATGEILGFMDPDDALKPNASEIMVRAHIEKKDCAIITSRYELVDLEMNFISFGTHGSSIPEEKSYLTFGEGALTHFATFKKKMYLKSGGIDIRMKRAVDQDLYYKMEEQGEHLFISESLYKYRIHDNSISCNDNLFKAHYWHFYAILRAYERRNKLGLAINNFSPEYIRKYKSDFYIDRFKRIRMTDKLKSKLYFLLKSIMVFPEDKFKYKIKTLILVVLGRV